MPANGLEHRFRLLQIPSSSIGAVLQSNWTKPQIKTLFLIFLNALIETSVGWGEGRQRKPNYRSQMLSDDILSFLVGWKLTVCSCIPRDLPNGQNCIGSGLEEGSNWLIRWLRRTQDNWLSTFQTLPGFCSGFRQLLDLVEGSMKLLFRIPYIHVHIHIHMCIYMCVRICMYICTHIHTYIHIIFRIPVISICLVSWGGTFGWQLGLDECWVLHVAEKIFIYKFALPHHWSLCSVMTKLEVPCQIHLQESKDPFSFFNIRKKTRICFILFLYTKKAVDSS